MLKQPIQPTIDLSTLDSEALLSDREVAAAFRLHPGVMRNWRSSGRGPHYVRLGRKVMYTLKAVRQFLADATVDPTQSRNP